MHAETMRLACPRRQTHSKQGSAHCCLRKLKMSQSSQNLPTSGYAIIVDGLVKTEFATSDGVETVARDLKRRFPMLQVKIYDAAARAHRDVNKP